MNTLLHSFFDLTLYNPIFVFVGVTAIWFIPGIVLRRFLERRYKTRKAEAQAKKISRLYPEDHVDS